VLLWSVNREMTRTTLRATEDAMEPTA